MAKFVRKVNAHIDVNAMCFLYMGQQRGSFGSVAEGAGNRIMVEESASMESLKENVTGGDCVYLVAIAQSHPCYPALSNS
jgi:hypothetical protein